MDPKPGRRRDIDSDDEEEVGRIQDELSPADRGQLQERFLDTFSNWIGSSGVHLRAFCRGNFYLILPSEKETDLVSFSAFCIVLHHV